MSDIDFDREEEFDDSNDLDDGFYDEIYDDGQPDEYTEWQDYMGGDDWDHGQFDGGFFDD